MSKISKQQSIRFFIRELKQKIASTEYKVSLKLQGIGFKASLLSSQKLLLDLGFIHKVLINVPDHISIDVKANLIHLKSKNKQSLMNFARFVQLRWKPEPYKQKGIHI